MNTNLEASIKQLKAAVTKRAVFGVLLIVVAAVAMATVAPWGTFWFLVALAVVAVGIIVLWTAWKPATELDQAQAALNAQGTPAPAPTAPAPTTPAPAPAAPVAPAPAPAAPAVDPDDPFVVAEALFAATPSRTTARVIRARREATEEALLRADELLSQAEAWEDEVVRAENARRAALARAQARRAGTPPTP